MTRAFNPLWIVPFLIAAPLLAQGESSDPPERTGKISLMTLVPELTPVSDYRGDVWERSTLLGDLGGKRQDLYEKGIALDVALTQLPQGVIGGGRDKNWEYSGLADYTLFLDSGRLGLWPGALLGVHAQTGFGQHVFLDSGNISPVNFNGLLPVPGRQNETYLSEYYLYQGLTDWMVVMLGRINFADLVDRNRFASDARNQFLNTSLRVDPLLGAFVPLVSTHGVGLVLQPTPDIAITLGVADQDDNPPEYGSVDGLFNEVAVGTEIDVSWKLFGLPGTARPAFFYGTKNPAAIDNRYLLLDLILNRPIPRKDGNWIFNINFDQYLYVPEQQETSKVHTAAFDLQPEGIGVFFRFGYVPEDRNPWNVFLSGGLGGRGVIPGRPNDRYGLGFYAMLQSDDLKNQLILGRVLGTEWGMEVYYNLALTPWLQLTPDLQYIQSGLPGVDDSVVFGTRLQIYF